MACRGRAISAVEQLADRSNPGVSPTADIGFTAHRRSRKSYAIEGRAARWCPIPSPGVPAGSFLLLMVVPRQPHQFFIAPAWPYGPANGVLARVGARSRWRLPRLTFALIFLNQLSDVETKSSRHRRAVAHSAAFFRSQARYQIAKAVYAPASMTDLKVSVTR